MKKLKFISCSILCLGFVYSLCHAANDYGLRSNKLNKYVLAQYDDTSTGGTTCDGLIIYCEQYMERTTKSIVATSNSEGTISVAGVTLLHYKKNTQYTLYVAEYNCRPQPGSANMCDSRKQGTKVITISEGSNTTNPKP